ncbi:DegT/DnrJ/EryC1/StrS family aminotransferase [Erythrobacter litoralis]|uniref:DegT/DnrJ/EryC1/StrS family protein n=1 Tax=Erythrobacter litoralis (strain HTCC2594) TaxID=314225 RepID=Q2N6E1_ERYLH|nr:DegT/DnrJ/EryC1/StrS family aminotransferase [Erythrobacter litoralis]ABC64750.1 DegT/DnrJ/EryC1/StrS family protein [Erythrobacter litoralis HTCC2594]
MQFIDLKSQYLELQDEIRQRIDDVLDRQAFIQGPEVKELEAALAKFCGAKRVVTCANGTDALQLALMALDIGPGDAVFVPSFTYTATAEVILLLGARPVFVDSDPDTFNICFDSAEKAIERTKAEGKYRAAALMTVDLFGQPVDYDRARSLADTHDLAFISDAAQGFGGTYKGRRVGSGLADITTTSFFPAKPLGCYGDGGAVFTDNDEWADAMKSICLHGKGAAKYDVVRVGVNSRLDTLQAAILLPKLAAFADELEKRHEVARSYSEGLANHVQTPILAEGDERFAWAQYTIKVEDRDDVQQRLKDAGVPANVYYPRPMHLQPAYLEFGDGEGSLPVAERLSEIVLSLPMHPYLSSDETSQVVDAVISAVRA